MFALLFLAFLPLAFVMGGASDDDETDTPSESEDDHSADTGNGDLTDAPVDTGTNAGSDTGNTDQGSTDTGSDTTAGGDAGSDTNSGADTPATGKDPEAGDSIVGASPGPGEGVDLRGGALNDTLRGTDYSDTLNGSSGDDTLWLEGGDDGNTLDEASAKYVFSTSSINSLVFRLESNDYFGGTGGSGDDYIDGGSGNDSLLGGYGDDTLRGNTGDDVLFDYQGSDSLNGGYGDDELVAVDTLSGYSDTLDGGAGNDVLFADDGDQVTGGTGWDNFVVSPSKGVGQAATITDFNPTPSGTAENGDTGEVLLIDVFNYKASDDFTIGQTGADVTVSLWGQSVAVLQNTQLSDLQPTSVVLGIDSTLNTASPEIHLPRRI